MNEIIVGVLARAQRMYEVEICGYVFASNHAHLLLWVKDARQLSRFMNFVNSNLAREAGRLVHWREKFWSRRYRSIVISEEEAAQTARLKYILSHGPKEGLVPRPQDWPGVHCVRPLLTGEVPEGYWFDRSQENAARARREDFDRLRYATRETLRLDPLPCWRGLSPDQIRQRVAGLLEQIDAETAAARQDAPPLGVEAVLSQDPHSRPRHSKKSRAPRFHTATEEARRILYEAYSWFLAAFRDAAEKLRRGDLSARFPAGSFPPALPFVGA